MKMFRRSVRVSKGNSSQVSDIAVYNSLAKEIGHTEERAEELEEAVEVEVEVEVEVGGGGGGVGEAVKGTVVPGTIVETDTYQCSKSKWLPGREPGTA
jgi:hypothetical protein